MGAAIIRIDRRMALMSLHAKNQHFRFCGWRCVSRALKHFHLAG